MAVGHVDPIHRSAAGNHARRDVEGRAFARDNSEFRPRNRASVADALGIAFLTKVGGGTSHGEILELSRKPVLQLVATSGAPDRPTLPSLGPVSLRRGATQVDVTGDLAEGNIMTFMTAEWSDTHMHVAWPRHMETM